MFLHKDYMPYVITLYQQSVEENSLPKVIRAAKATITAIDKTPKILEFVKTPFIPFEEKIALLEALIAKSTPVLFISFLNILGQNKKLPVVHPILSKFLEYADHKTGMEAINVTSAYKLSTKIKTEIQTILEKQLQKPVQIKTNEDPKLIGGLLIKYHHHDVDLSIKKTVFSLKSELKKVYS